MKTLNKLVIALTLTLLTATSAYAGCSFTNDDLNCRWDVEQGSTLDRVITDSKIVTKAVTEEVVETYEEVAEVTEEIAEDAFVESLKFARKVVLAPHYLAHHGHLDYSEKTTAEHVVYYVSKIHATITGADFVNTCESVADFFEVHTHTCVE